MAIPFGDSLLSGSQAALRWIPRGGRTFTSQLLLPGPSPPHGADHLLGPVRGGGGALLRGSSLNSLLGAKCQESELNPRPSCLGAVWLPDCGRGSGRGNGRSLPSRLFQCVESSMPGTWYPSPLCWNMGQKSFRSSLLAYPMWF